MNPIYIRIIMALLMLSMITSCKKNAADTTNADLIVVNGYLYQGEPVDSIHLTKTVSFESTDTIYPPVTDAQVSISWNNNTFDLQSIGNGYYNYPGSDLSVKEGDSYSIAVKYNDKVATSTTTVPKKPTGIELSDTIIYVDTTFSFTPPGSGSSNNSNDNGLKITWDNPENNYYYVVIENTDPNARDIVRGSDSFFGDRPRNFTFRSSPFKGDEYTINAMNLKKYGKQRVKVYRVNQEYADLYENRNQDSRTLSEPITNITNGLGIFTAFSYAESYFTVENAINK